MLDGISVRESRKPSEGVGRKNECVVISRVCVWGGGGELQEGEEENQAMATRGREFQWREQ